MSRSEKILIVVCLTAGMVLSAIPPASATFPGADGLIVYGVNSGALSRLRSINPDGTGSHTFLGVRSPADVAFSSDGTQVVVADVGPHGFRIILFDLTDGTHSLVLRPPDAPSTIYSVSLSPDGSTVAFCSSPLLGRLWTIHIDGSDLTKLHAKDYCYADYSPDGRLVASKGIFPGDGSRILTVMDADGTNKHVIVTLPPAKSSWGIVYAIVPSWSPDGTSIVFGAQRHRVEPDIWAVNSDGSALHKLTDTNSRWESSPVYSPDGTTIVFSRTSVRGGNTDLWTMGADGSNVARLTNSPNREEVALSWQPT